MVYGDMGVTNSGDNLKQIIAHRDEIDFGAVSCDGAVSLVLPHTVLPCLLFPSVSHRRLCL